MKVIGVISVFLLLISCKKEETVLPKASHDIRMISYLYENDIYFMSDFESNPAKITNSPEVEKTELRMSPDATKFAYIRDQNTIEIVNYKNELIKHIPNLNNLKSYDWSEDGNTLIYFANGDLNFDGPSVEYAIPEIPASVPTSGSASISNIAISNNGTAAYVVSWYYVYDQWTTEYHYYLVRKKLNESPVILSDAYYNYTHLQFSQNNDLHAMYNYTYNMIYSENSDEALSINSDLHYGIYNSKKEAMIGLHQNPSDPVKYKLAIYYLGGKLETNNSTSLGLSGINNIDWKQQF
ncbi:hypothetical protein K6119_17660 [Paracrocinitomix mangrovi]|uniref:hypothetical protein n=1 Tax=Paracrocinitomix mangrovi TaxID=2862509 RepID=UPI001C8EA4F7|nr:hypothetical protein [Paracrocinitomix mangrovi]UKN01553.1 hypothetical protein K6119_17660 [Paracrocinitomix mangrovi]